jgi:hypothetical protein
VKQWKIAISLAVVGAIAAPFVFHTYEADVTGYYVGVIGPLTAQHKEDLTAYVRKLNNCKVFETTPRDDPERITCYGALAELDHGGDFHWEFSVPRYLAWNVGTSAAAFAVVFGLAYLLPAVARLLSAIARRYWRWLNT